MSRRHWSFRAAALGLSVAALTMTAGCLPDVSMSPGVSLPETSAAATSESRPTVVPVVEAPARPVGELDTGTATHVLPAGDRKVVIDYWTDEAATAWTAAGTKTVQVSAHLEDDTSKQTVLVTRFVATADDGSARTTVVEDRGEFAIAPPFSYGTVLSLQPSAANAEHITLYVQLELLVETGRGSGRYFRQTVLDSLVLPLIKEKRK
jgi:hypothetical protein